MNTPTGTGRRARRPDWTHHGAGHEYSPRDRRRCRRRASGDVAPGDRAGDHELLDLLGALEDVEVVRAVAATTIDVGWTCSDLRRSCSAFLSSARPFPISDDLGTAWRTSALQTGSRAFRSVRLG